MKITSFIICVISFVSCDNSRTETAEVNFSITDSEQEEPSVIQHDSTIIVYINKQNEYISLREFAHIPNSIKPYMQAISAYMRNNHMPIDEYWIWTPNITEDSNTLFIPICHYDGFMFQYALEKENEEARKKTKSGEPAAIKQINGNISGKDGTLEMDKTSKRVTGFSLWL